MNNITIYTDGACSKNPGPGGYAFIILSPTEKVLLKLSGGEKHTTNNRMELKAIVRALEHFDEPREHLNYRLPYDKNEMSVTIRSDSAYCVNAVKQGWIHVWNNNGWKTKEDHEVKNKELWQRLLELISQKHLKVTFEKVKGHSGDKYNEMVDKAAKNVIQRLKEEELLFQAKGGKK